MEREESVLDSFSPASKYEALLLETGGGPGVSEAKTSLLFQTLDQVLPHLGVFSKVMKLIRNEVFDTVYSDQYTGADTARFIQRIPYFVLTRRIYNERDEKNDELSGQLDVVKKRLFDKQKQFEDATEKISNLQHEAEDLRGNIETLEQDLAERKEDIQSLEDTLEEERDRNEKQEYQLNCDIAELREDLEESRNEANFLRQFKVGYDDLQAAFDNPVGLDELIPRKKKRAAIATKRSHLIAGIENSAKLEEQILTVQNLTIEEFDKFMEEHKLELVMKLTGDHVQTYEDQEYAIDNADQDLMMMQERFEKGIQDITTELELLRQHKTMMTEQLQILEENRPSVKKKKRSRQGSRPQTQESSLSEGLGGDEEEDENPAMDPFIPQERIFSKYASMVYTSDNNGKTFHEFKDAKFCPSCGEKTVICPHKILNQEHVFRLAPGSTHLKVSRPKVRVNLEVIEHLLRPATRDDALAHLQYSAGGKARDVSATAMMSPMTTLPSMSPGLDTNQSGVMGDDSTSVGLGMGGGDETHFKYSIGRLWEDYKARTELERAVPRTLALDRVISLIEQFAAHLFYQDDFALTSDKCKSVLDNLYDFMQERYIKPDITYMAVHDFITAIMEYSSNNKLVWLLAQILVGNLDAAVFRYLLLIGDFINDVRWEEVEDFRAFVAVVYPFLTDDELETLQMGYTSFSENKISATLVSEYIVYIIMKYREPRFLEMEAKLLSHPGKEPELMAEEEFIEASDMILQVPNDKLRRRLYQESQVYVSNKDGVQGGIPVLRLAQITSYLSLLHLMPVIRDGMMEKVEDARNIRSQSASHKGKRVRFKTNSQDTDQRSGTPVSPIIDNDEGEDGDREEEEEGDGKQESDKVLGVPAIKIQEPTPEPGSPAQRGSPGRTVKPVTRQGKGQNHHVSSQYKLMTMTEAKTLAHNVARRYQCRKNRMDEEAQFK